MPSTSSAVYRRSIGRPEIVVKLAARSGDFFSAGSSVSCCHRAFPVSATVFIQTALYPPALLVPAAHVATRRREAGVQSTNASSGAGPRVDDVTIEQVRSSEQQGFALLTSRRRARYAAPFRLGASWRPHTDRF